MTKHQNLLVKYNELFTPFSIEYDETDNGLEAYIYTERFLIKSFTSNNQTFEQIEPIFKRLYNVTYNDQIVAKPYGGTKTVEEFTNRVNNYTRDWKHKYTFSGFAITDKDEEQAVGIEAICNSKSSIPENFNTSDLSYIFNKYYHKSSIIQNVGYECVGALVLGHGYEQYKAGSLINQLYDTNEGKYLGGTRFYKIKCTAHFQNIGSSRILDKLGFEKTGNYKLVGEKQEIWYEYKKDYENDDLPTIGSENSIQE